MRLLYITTKISGPGGVQRVMAAKTNFLIKEKGYEIDIILSNVEPEESVFYEFNEAVQFHVIKPNKSYKEYFFSYKRLINEKVEKINPDIIIMCDNGLKSFLLPFILKKKYPLIYEMHVSKHLILQSMSFCTLFTDKIIKTFMHFSASRFDKFIVLTSESAEEWKLKNMIKIPNPLWFTGSENELNTKTAVSIGRHTYEKGFDRLLDIWKAISLKHPDWSLNIYGDVKNAEEIIKKADEMQLSDSITFLNPTKDVIEIYKKASLYLMTSRLEGFGMVLLEAMECGVPCIAYNCPVGPSEIIIDGYNGRLINDGDSNAFKEAILELIENNSVRQEMGQNARYTSSKFNIYSIMDKWDSLFNDLKNIDSYNDDK